MAHVNQADAEIGDFAQEPGGEEGDEEGDAVLQNRVVYRATEHPLVIRREIDEKQQGHVLHELHEYLLNALFVPLPFKIVRRNSIQKVANNVKSTIARNKHYPHVQWIADVFRFIPIVKDSAVHARHSRDVLLQHSKRSPDFAKSLKAHVETMIIRTSGWHVIPTNKYSKRERHAAHPLNGATSLLAAPNQLQQD